MDSILAPDPAPAPAPAPAPDPAAAPGTDWRSSLPEDVRGDKSLESIKGKDWTEAGPTLVKNYINGQKMIGGSIRIPGKDAKPEEIAAYREKLGVPATADKYDLKPPATLEKFFTGDLATSFRGMAHKAGYTSEQANALLEWYGSTVGVAQNTLAMSGKDAAAVLKTEWGGAYEKNLTLAQRAVREAGGTELLKYLDDTGLGNHPALVRAFARMGLLMAEDGSIPGDIVGVPGPAEAQAKINAIMADPKDLYHGKFAGTPGHTERVAEVSRLYQLLYSAV